ncbi:hypothetical protein GPEL0_01r3391 [Geoanaerobacter pelophilus]|uniref:Secreted protein n=1 Tax=Geoanaerobacter pelophilus TaxID=60036 RepID=A0ABQ0MKB3_9BACT|nr:hypothetical protein [Geoanaerobacter pelophilus]GAW67525.1 hypothetical protein GPEL0_01r3391 [Geoanaerobacter pelophilus]
MRKAMVMALTVLCCGASPVCAGQRWYTGDARCVPPRDDGTYSAPYDPLEHPGEFPTFPGADKPGWFCSYQREDGVIVQFGNSQTPQQQWLAVWSSGANDLD